MTRYFALGVIPARYASTRFPGKALALLQGRPILEWVWRQARKARNLDEVWIATDDRRIADAARGFGAIVVMTSRDCLSGGDRVAEAVAKVDVDIVVNIQGDEPQIDPAVIDRAVEALRDDPRAGVSTVRVPFRRLADYRDPNAVKVVTDLDGRALYFSRSPLPSFARLDYNELPEAMPAPAYKHVGLYAYRKAALMDFGRMPPTPLERVEKLEQLRYLENGCVIKVVEADRDAIGVDTPEDLERLALIFDGGIAE